MFRQLAAAFLTLILPLLLLIVLTFRTAHCQTLLPANISLTSESPAQTNLTSEACERTDLTSQSLTQNNLTTQSSVQISETWPIRLGYLLGDGNRCKTEPPDIIIWVQGRMTSPRLRSMIRETFGNQKMWPRNTTVTLIFFTGKAAGDDGTHQRRLEYEFEMYNDIVQTDFTEDYRNQVSKLISAINYIADNCAEAKLILKIDDDVIFYPDLLLNNLLKAMSNVTTNDSAEENNLNRFRLNNNNTVACNMLYKRRVIRAKNQKYSVPEDTLSDRELYPSFCAGFFVAMSGDVPSILQPYMARNKPFWIDDSYMGVLQEQARTNNVDIKRFLNFGLGKVPKRNLLLRSFFKGETLVRHLKNNFKFQMSNIFSDLQTGVT